MTPDLMEEGARRMEAHKALLATQTGQTESGGRDAGFSRLHTPGAVSMGNPHVVFFVGREPTDAEVTGGAVRAPG